MDFPPEPKPSAVVILQRPDGDVFLVQRPKTASFFPGFHAFPGGGVDPGDERGDDLETLRACAVREVAEEVQLDLDQAELAPAGVVVTPPFSPIRYRTQFFLVDVPSSTEPDPQRPELAGGRWVDPGNVLGAWREGEIKLPPPVIHTLELLAEGGPDAITARGTEVDEFPITFLPGLRVEPLEVRTLPPHSHTNAFLVGEEALAVVDPGAPSPELDRLERTLGALGAAGDPLKYVVLTHHHEDHVGGASELIERFGAKLACSAETGKRLGVDPDVILSDGDRIELGEHVLVALETPGHAPGHLCLHVPRARTVLAGDLVAGLGTVLIAPGEGDMAAYMDSLDRLASFCEDEDVRLAFPAHGPPLFGPASKIRETLEHRRMREQRVLEAVQAGHEDLSAIAEAAYEDKPDAPAQLKELSTRAHLEKLVGDGLIEAPGEDDRWEAA